MIEIGKEKLKEINQAVVDLDKAVGQFVVKYGLMPRPVLVGGTFYGVEMVTDNQGLRVPRLVYPSGEGGKPLVNAEFQEKLAFLESADTIMQEFVDQIRSLWARASKIDSKHVEKAIRIAQTDLENKK